MPVMLCNPDELGAGPLHHACRPANSPETARRMRGSLVAQGRKREARKYPASQAGAGNGIRCAVQARHEERLDLGGQLAGDGRLPQ